MINRIFAFFERFIKPFPEEDPTQPPKKFMPFIWHYAKPFKILIVVNVCLGVLIAIAEVWVFSFVGDLVDWISTTDKASFWSDYGGSIALMGLVVMFLLPFMNFVSDSIEHQGMMGNFPMRVRWQAHRYLLRHSVSFFEDDFAGRIATKVMQTSLAVRETVMKLSSIFVYVLVYFSTTIVLFALSDWRLTLPLVLWLVGYVFTLLYFIPKFRDISKAQAENRSLVTGRMVDSYSNIHTVKMFSNHKDEDEYTKDGMADFLTNVHYQMRMATLLNTTLTLLNSALIFLIGAVSLFLWNGDLITVGAIAFALGIIMRIQGLSQWTLWEVASLFENIGIVQDGMTTLSRARYIQDSKDALPMRFDKGQIVFDKVNFHYNNEEEATRNLVLNNINLTINPGEKIGVVGRSGAGKSTLVNLLLRFYDIEEGRILIDDQDIKEVKQESLRRYISMVSQDSSLLHRSVLANIHYGKNNASADDVVLDKNINELAQKNTVPEEIILAAKKAHAHEFIETLEDSYGRKGYFAHVGERGVKLSGGQRQRIAIARAIVKDAPILVLDEATSALDSEVESAIQESLYQLMQGKTVIAIAHRLSTIAQMDRLIVMDKGEIIEQGSHDELIKHQGLYAQLWAMQSGGFIGTER